MVQIYLLIVIVILAVALASVLIYFTFFQEKPSAIDLAKQQVTTKESAQKATTDIKSVSGDIQKELGDLQNVLRRNQT